MSIPHKSNIFVSKKNIMKIYPESLIVVKTGRQQALTATKVSETL